MSELGQKRKYLASRGTSVLPSTADIVRLPSHARFVPKADEALMTNPDMAEAITREAAK